MDQKLAFLHQRRSVRAFGAAPVAEADRQALLAAGMAAPSACNKRPYQVIVMDDPKVLAAVAAALPNGPFLAKAPFGLLVCGDLAAAHANELSYMLQDCAAFIENVLLAVSALGLGACWLGIHPRPERIDALRAHFKLPDNIIPVSAIAIGHPDGPVPPPRDSFDLAKLHLNAW